MSDVHDVTNLCWPEAPFGAGQRPFGKAARLLAAFAFDWPTARRDGVPLCVSTIYLRLVPRGCVVVSPGSLTFGFRAVVAERPADALALRQLADRALARARRHAAILAGYDWAPDLDRLAATAPQRLGGVEATRDAVTSRDTKSRGLAQVIDVRHDLVSQPAEGVDLSIQLGPSPALGDESLGCIARRGVARCLAIGLVAANGAGRYSWEGRFDVDATVDSLGWDVLAPAGHYEVPPA